VTASARANEFPEPEYERVRDLVRAVSGLEIPTSRRSVLDDAVLASMAEVQASSPSELLDQLNGGGDHRHTIQALVARLTIGETHFFRNRPQFEALKTLVLPQLIEKRRAAKRLRLWSAGCATGEEPYSLAIMLERLLPDIADWNIHILATDVNRASLARAKVGVYGPRAFREVPDDIQKNVFTRTGSTFEVPSRIRRMVSLSYLNLVRDDYPSVISTTNTMDLILCRNVLIYFNEATIRAVVDRLHSSLDCGGWLVVGPAEPSQAIFHRFVAHNVAGAVLYQRPIADILTRIPVPMPAPPSQIAPPPAPVTPLADRTRLPDPPPDEIRSVLDLVRKGQSEAAIDALVALETAHQHEVWVLYLLARTHADRGELADAEHYIDRVLLLAPLLTAAHHLRGLILQELGRFDESLDAMRRCIYIDPEFWLAYFSMAGLLGHMAQPHKALKILGTLAGLLAARDDRDLVPQSDSMSVGRLSEVVAAHRELLRR